MRPRQMRMWLDIETTGLDPDTDALLEIGVVLTTDGGKVCGSYEATFPYSGPMTATVRKMHDASGLSADCARLARMGGGTIDQAIMWAWIASLARKEGGDDVRLIVCGSGVERFDIPFLTAKGLWNPPVPVAYWADDISPIRRFLRAAGVDFESGSSAGAAKAHRALADAQAHLDEWLAMRAAVTRLVAAP